MEDKAAQISRGDKRELGGGGNKKKWDEGGESMRAREERRGGAGREQVEGRETRRMDERADERTNDTRDARCSRPQSSSLGLALSRVTRQGQVCAGKLSPCPRFLRYSRVADPRFRRWGTVKPNASQSRNGAKRERERGRSHSTFCAVRAAFAL